MVHYKLLFLYIILELTNRVTSFIKNRTCVLDHIKELDKWKYVLLFALACNIKSFCRHIWTFYFYCDYVKIIFIVVLMYYFFNLLSTEDNRSSFSIIPKGPPDDQELVSIPEHMSSPRDFNSSCCSNINFLLCSILSMTFDLFVLFCSPL
jgi:hypothetical protein